jgi:undecaprenyl-diphosphatase
VLTLASLINVAENVGYPVIFLLVLAESGGVPVPGETALITGALLASRHQLSIEAVIAIAASAAIIGDNIGYFIGRKGGRWLLERPGRFASHRREVLDIGEPFFERHGPKAVFLGRWILGLRTWASWLAGASQMPWLKFSFWNALGGITWAISIGLLAYTLGSQVKSVFADFGVFGLITTALVLLGGYLLYRQHRRRDAAAEHAEQQTEEQEAEPKPEDEEGANMGHTAPLGRH